MEKTKCPGTVETASGANRQHFVNIDKDNEICFENPIRQRIFELFLTGKHYSVVELTEMFHNPDIRSHIRYIRNSGVSISDYWVKSEFSRYKVYFYHDRAQYEWLQSLEKLF